MSFLIKQLTIVGVGLMGASLALALKRKDLVGEVVGVDRRRNSLDYALENGVIDRATTSIAEGAKGASVVLIATPVAAIVPTVKDCLPGLEPGCVVTDVGSVKGNIVAQCEAMMPEGCSFVGGHPIAGREHSGVEAALASLFDGSRTILTPSDTTDKQAVELISEMWEAVGAGVEKMEPAWHDQVLAATSHLPHLMAYNVVNTLSDLEDHLRSEVFRYAASGFRDFTRIASSDPTMWRDICLENRDAILTILNRFRDDLDKLTTRVESGDADGLYGIFARSKDTRQRILQENKVLRGD
uniref:prephenate dehydrogenase n=1 Tax=Magnetococcus massalia (strain MO-1) TaxID=451514 RepID=A0A1S7LNS3_MAGMO|nr:tein tyrC: Cyclohexadienyl dehydrogenase; Prephenate dehydrogenase [Candidatus Magnetococcus massalia]